MATGLENIKVLVVDPNRHMRNLVQMLMGTFGIVQVRDADSVATAFQILRAFPADIIITELAMTPIDGIEFTRLVRSGKDMLDPFLPVIMVTAYTEFHRVVGARDAGITEFLAKPFAAKTLWARLASVLVNPRRYIRCKSYFGPDRRRHPEASQGERERRAEIIAAMPRTGPLTAEQVSIVLEDHPTEVDPPPPRHPRPSRLPPRPSRRASTAANYSSRSPNARRNNPARQPIEQGGFTAGRDRVILAGPSSGVRRPWTSPSATCVRPPRPCLTRPTARAAAG